MKYTMGLLLGCLWLLWSGCGMGKTYEPQQVVVFTKEGCPRCAEAKEILQSRNRLYVEKNISDPKNRQEMWDLLHEQSGGEPVRLVMPVVVVDGELFFNLPQLQQFFSGI
jgi:glutaredoxin